MHVSISALLSVLSLVVSITVAWLTLFRRGRLYMTQPVQIAFVFEAEKPKVFLRTLLYATGKRGYVVEGLFLKVRQPESTHTFGFWGYGERNELMVAGGLRVTEDGIAYNHHFLETAHTNGFQFVPGKYEIMVYARLVNRRAARHLSTVKLSLSAPDAMLMRIKGVGLLFTWDPDMNTYNCTVNTRPE